MCNIVNTCVYKCCMLYMYIIWTLCSGYALWKVLVAFLAPRVFQRLTEFEVRTHVLQVITDGDGDPQMSMCMSLSSGFQRQGAAVLMLMSWHSLQPPKLEYMKRRNQIHWVYHSHPVCRLTSWLEPSVYCPKNTSQGHVVGAQCSLTMNNC